MSEMLVTITEAKQLSATLAGLSDDIVEKLIKISTNLIEKALHRTFEKDIKTELYDGDGTTQLFLNNFPVDIIYTIDIDGTVYDNDDPSSFVAPTGFICNVKTGEIRPDMNSGSFVTFRNGFQNIEVIYSSGYDNGDSSGNSDIPLVIRDGCVDLCQWLETNKISPISAAGIKSESEGDYSVTYGGVDDKTEYSIPAFIWKRIALYRNKYI